MALKELPSVYNKATSKRKNKEVKKLLQSDLANSFIDMATGLDTIKLICIENYIVLQCIMNKHVLEAWNIKCNYQKFY